MSDMSRWDDFDSDDVEEQHDVLSDDDSDDDDFEDDDCCFPGECCMPGFHPRSECHTAEMLEAYWAEVASMELGQPLPNQPASEPEWPSL